ncbi:MAG: CAP domain-containing protein [Campylobacter sp.]|uniref:CAP domain-containing protein n=1 Tax=Campylobacter sp. TaxID=205 RepID=UPI002AA88F04|nr:CAP domain-containing protein [Campylobacter sp.]MCI6695066.1 CAP domain-containing protein [Campylobacter sp.]
MLRLVLGLSIIIALLAFAFFKLSKESLEPTKFPKNPSNLANFLDTDLTGNSRIPSQKSRIPSEFYTSFGLSYLNLARKSVGLVPFKENSILSKAAKNHTLYLSNLGTISHDESKENKHFTGANPSERAIFAGLSSSFVSENISAKHASFNDSIDGLLSAIYHRFNFLNYSFDEIGYYDDGDIYTYEMSNSALLRLCERGESVGRQYVLGACANPKMPLSPTSFNLATKPSKPDFLMFPNESFASVAVFGDEDPDPLPQCEITSAPVSLEFNPNLKIFLRSFKIFKDGKELENTLLLSRDNDLRFTSNQFALFSLSPFDFGASYEVLATYTQGGQNKSLSWSFATKEPQIPYFIVNDGDIIELEDGKEYEVFFAPKHCNDSFSKYSYSLPFGSSLQLKDTGINMLKMRASGVNGDVINFKSATHNIKIVIKSEKNLDFKVIFALILAIVLFIFIVKRAKI